MTNVISFPGLGLEFNVNRVAFTILDKDIFWYALIILTGFLLGSTFVACKAKKRGVNPEAIWDIALYGLVFGIIGARLYYVMFDFESVKGSVLNVFKIWEGGLAIYGGIIAAVITAYVYCKKKELDVLLIFDLCCQGLFIGQSIGRWGNFVNAEVYGKETELLWGMSINGAPAVHPLFLYESLWNLLGLIIAVNFANRNKIDGRVFFFYILWYSLGRLLLEGMRQTQYILYAVEGIVGISQIVAAVGIIVGIVGLVSLSKRAEKTL